ncbi:MAG: AmmeMemoRadiSam system radical SAM enzyme [Chloroflexota bacterium]
MHEAMLYEKLSDNRVRCNLCAHRCVIKDGKRGICQVRENQSGTLYTLVYGRTIAQHTDPIEKKPLFHFHPGTTAYSIATPGCNFRCPWCQNWEISQIPGDGEIAAGIEASPNQIVADARRAGCKSIAYTYTEPTIFFEYAYDTARLAHESGLANIYVTNGYMTEDMLNTFHPYLDAMNVDLKGFSEKMYKEYVGAKLQPVLDALQKAKELGIFLEVTTLIIPGINDSQEELKEATNFIATELGTDTPWHISRFFPAYNMSDVPATPVETLKQAVKIGKEAGLRYVYLGNAPGQGDENTHCPSCGNLVVERMGYYTRIIGLDGSKCHFCGAELNFRT